MTKAPHTLWYFSYGSNLDPQRFRSRVGPWHEARPAVLDGYRVRFSGDVRSEGGGGAFVEPAAGEAAFGAVFLIDEEQLRAMDEIELLSERNLEGRGMRRSVEVKTEGGTVRAEMYTLDGTSRYLAPSPPYLGHILDGLRAAGHPDEALDRLRARAAAEPVPDAPRPARLVAPHTTP